jgi:DNA-binding CsgD family transcriptional regulator
VSSILSPLELRVVTLAADGYRNAAIAAIFGRSVPWVASILHRVYDRLQARNRAHAVAICIRAGLIPWDAAQPARRRP